MFNKAIGKIVRYCRPTQVDEKGVLVSAFFLRKKNLELNRPEDEKTLSVDDFNFYKTDNYKNIKSALLKRMPSAKETGYFALIDYPSSAKLIKQITDVDIDIISEEKSSHCNITNLFGIDERAAVGFVQNILEVKPPKGI
jgi:hypothetical protein